MSLHTAIQLRYHFPSKHRDENNALWFLKQSHCEVKGKGIYSVQILGVSSSTLAVLVTILMFVQASMARIEKLIFLTNDKPCIFDSDVKIHCISYIIIPVFRMLVYKNKTKGTNKPVSRKGSESEKSSCQIPEKTLNSCMNTISLNKGPPPLQNLIIRSNLSR